MNDAQFIRAQARLKRGDIKRRAQAVCGQSTARLFTQDPSSLDTPACWRKRVNSGAAIARLDGYAKNVFRIVGGVA